MISQKITLSPSVTKKLSKSWINENSSKLVDAVATDMLWNIQEYGFGSAKGNTPSGGSPIWQGRIMEKGHYRGYLTESHQIKKVDSHNAKIVSSADFVEGVIEGVSTNWFDSDMNPVVFGENLYHKRAVDKTFAERKIPIIWKNVVDGVDK